MFLNYVGTTIIKIFIIVVSTNINNNYRQCEMQIAPTYTCIFYSKISMLVYIMINKQGQKSTGLFVNLLYTG